MRVLWFSITPAKFGSYASNGGGWIESLQRVVAKQPQIELGIAFMSGEKSSSNTKGIVQDGVVYYPIYINRTPLQQWYDKYTYKRIDELTIAKCKDIISEFKPDVIQVFGSEWCFGLICSQTNVPVIIHMQGCWSAYHNMNQILKNSRWYIFWQRFFKPRRFLNYLLNEHISQERVIREEKIMSLNKYFIGRTKWDKSIVELFSPNASYFYGSEALRNVFVESKDIWQYKERGKRIFVTTGLGVELKGLDLVLHTAALLKKWSQIDFEWRLMGPTPFQMKVYEHKTGITCKSVNVVPCGNNAPSQLLNELLNADCYIHTSYIDNSPNAVCEAQYLGLPVIATHVGGTPSLFAEDYNTRLLVGSNDPHDMASAIIWLLNSRERMSIAGQSNYTVARRRHDDDSIGEDLINTYKKVIEDNGGRL